MVSCLNQWKLRSLDKEDYNFEDNFCRGMSFCRLYTDIYSDLWLTGIGYSGVYQKRSKRITRSYYPEPLMWAAERGHKVIGLDIVKVLKSLLHILLWLCSKVLKITGYQSRITLQCLHRTLLHEHHNILPAPQYPSTSDPLRQLVAKYSMPIRMWHHDEGSFREL